MNLVETYSLHSYHLYQIWNCDKNGGQVGQNERALILAKIRFGFVHFITLNEHEWLLVFSCMNVVGEYLPSFYIFKGNIFVEITLSNVNLGLLWLCSESLDDYNLFEKWISHFVISIQGHGGNLALINQHLLILDGHNLHVTIDIVHKARKMRLELTTLPSHTSHALKPFDVPCFKLFKIAFRTYRNVWTLVNKGKGASKEYSI
jgi:hypothetical protein